MAPPEGLGDDEAVFGRGLVGLMPEHHPAASFRPEIDLAPGGLRDDIKLAVVPYGDVRGRIPGLPVVIPAHFRDAVTEYDPAIRMNAYRIRAEIVPELRVQYALRAQKLTGVRDHRNATARHVRDHDAPRNAFRASDIAEFPRSLAFSAHRASCADRGVDRKVDQVDLGALHQGETAVRKEKAGHDSAEFGKIRMLRRIEDGVARWAERSEGLLRCAAVLR